MHRPGRHRKLTGKGRVRAHHSDAARVHPPGQRVDERCIRESCNVRPQNASETGEGAGPGRVDQQPGVDCDGVGLDPASSGPVGMDVDELGGLVAGLRVSADAAEIPFQVRFGRRGRGLLGRPSRGGQGRAHLAL